MRNISDVAYLKNIEIVKKSLLEKLNKRYYNIQLTNIVEVSEIIEHDIIDSIVSELNKNSKIYLNMNISKDNLHFLDDKKNYYQLVHSKVITSPKTYCFKIQPLSISLKSKVQYIPIVGYGKYNEIIFDYPQKIKLNKSIVIHLIQEIYKSGYLWFVEAVSNVVNSDLGKLSNQLYSYLKKYLPNTEIRKNLWFASITDGYGFRLIDESVAKESFNIIKENSFATNYSTNRYVSELLKTYLPEEHLLMKKAIDLNKCIDTSLKEAKYKSDGSIYAITLSSLYGCDSFTVYPIFKNQKVSVVALFDSNNKSTIVPFLDVHKDKFSKICESQTKSIKKILRLMRKENVKSYWSSFSFKPNLFGLEVDLKELYRKITSQNK